MVRFLSITAIFISNLNFYFSQDICIPSELEVEPGNRNIFFSWKDINDNSVENKIFEECFELCTPTGTITHLVDNGNGGWYRGTDGNAYCANGFDCNLDDPTAGWAAISWWTAGADIAVDSRMTFGPFDISSNALTRLEFFEAYYYGEMLNDLNIVEISVDGGNTWESIYTSDPSILNFWTAISIDLASYAGQRIHIGFRYMDTAGDREAWLIDQVTIIEVLEGRSFQTAHENNENSIISTNTGRSINLPSQLDIDHFSRKSIENRVNRKQNKNNFGFPIRKSNLVYSSTQRITSSRNCSDPENEIEVSVVVTEGNWPDEISWFLNDSVSGETLLSGGAPFDTTLCLPMGYYNLVALDSYGDGWNDSYMTITDISNGSVYFNFTSPSGYAEYFETIYLGPLYGCTDPLATNWDPDANTDDGSCEYDLCEFNQVYLYCSPGNWPEEVSWYIEDSLGNQIIEGVVDQFYSICVPTGSYKVVGEDTYGDGWNSATLTAVDTADNILLNWTFNEGSIDSTYFWAGPKYGCTDPFADNYDPSATIDDSSCVYTSCYDVIAYAIYKDGLMVGSTTSNYHSFTGLENGREYNLGVGAIYAEGSSEISYIDAVPWNNVIFDPLVINLDTLGGDEMLEYNFSFSIDNDVFYTSPFILTSELGLDVDYQSSMLFSSFNENDFTTMYDPSGLFGGLWLLGDPNRASSQYFAYDSTLDSSNFAYINDDAIGAAGGAESAYLITNEITRSPGQRVFATFDVYFPQPYGSCSNGDPDNGGGTDGDGFSEDLFFMVSADFGGTWTVVDSTLGGNPNWTSRMFEITDELNGATSFIAALYYTDCNGNWSFGVGVDNFAIHLADQNELIAIDPYAGWAEAGSTIDVSISIPNHQTSYTNSSIEINAGYERLNIPVIFGLTLGTDDNGNAIIPLKNSLHQNYPNPFNPTTTIPFDIIKTDQITLSIYNVKGEKVRTLVSSHLNPGSYEVRWDGKSDRGVVLSAGMYFIELKGTNFRETNKIIYLK